MHHEKEQPSPKTTDQVTTRGSHFPKTHFFYEFEGERIVDPGVLVENGVLLWHEQIHANVLHDTSPLWRFAEELLEKRGEAVTHSDLEWLRFQIVTNALVPVSWNSAEPYPYKGRLISALYLQAARHLCQNGDLGRVWHVIALAYYNLGLSTVQSASSAFASYAAKAKADDSEYKRAIVLEVLKRLKGDTSITSIAAAKKAVINFIQDYRSRDGRYVLLTELEKLDRLQKVKHSEDNDAIERLTNTLNSWASPNGPYPEMTKAFAVFDKSNATAAQADQTAPRTTGEAFEFETSDYHTRIFNLLPNGDMLSLRFAHDPDHDK